MFKNKVFLFIIALSVLGIIFYSLHTSEEKNSSKNYTSQLKDARKELDKSLKNNTNSPIEDKSLFEGLKYYEPDSIFKITANYQEVSDTNKGAFMMTDSSKGELKKIAKVSFLLANKSFELILFQEDNNYFLPFRDLTNGKETYGGGRYINIPMKNLKGNKIEIDFNEAHNFYCAYNHTYVCPVPPPENFIKLEVKVGEKKLKE